MSKSTDEYGSTCDIPPSSRLIPSAGDQTLPPPWFETVEGIMKSLIDPITEKLEIMEKRLEKVEDSLKSLEAGLPKK
ncbi:hypothetical protein I3760_14G034200 [Carya illinoinensis]|nr:hypothetical protein I3760_14G034200 [Carya illinoinensis]